MEEFNGMGLTTSLGLHLVHTLAIDSMVCRRASHQLVLASTLVARSSINEEL